MKKEALAIEFKEQSNSTPEKSGFVLMPTMGAQDMPDSGNINDELENRNIQVLTPNLNERGAARLIPWDIINTVDLSNMRGCLTSFGRYRGILDYLHDCIVQQENKGRHINIFPDFDTIEWISSKAKYLKHITNNNISTIPTTALCCLKEPEKASIIAQPDNFEQMFKDIRNFIDAANTNRFVLKPSTSSLGRGLIFIDHDPETNNYTVSIPREENEEACQSVYNGCKNLERYLMNYFTNTPSPDNHFLFQEYVPNIETSAVFINGKPHFIERLQGEKSRIAHARYGGIDSFIDNPDLTMVNFVFEIMHTLPDDIQKSPFLRIDVMKNTQTGKYVLSEIEGAGATRFWLNKAGRLDDYADMIKELNVSSIKSSRPLHALEKKSTPLENIFS